MKTEFRNVIGLMSGTSLDGIDLVFVQFDRNDNSKFKILHTDTISYSKKWKETLQKAIIFSDTELLELDIKYGALLAREINHFIKINQLQNIDFIASHGHTILHQPDKGVTLQIGNGQIIANKTKQKVICDFRTQDVEFGGQGAPLVPIGDKLLFAKYDACLNLGGFANVSFNENNARIAFDICPVNIVLNYYVNILGFEFDDCGQIASTGNIKKELLLELNRLKFYSKNHPKSLGLEWVQSHVFPIIDKYDMKIKDILRTFVEHVAVQIAKNIENKRDIFITGGGVFNSFLIEKLKEHSKTKIIVPNTEIINYKEALIFAFLGVLRVDNQINCLSSVTGAIKDHSSGKIFNQK